MTAHACYIYGHREPVLDLLPCMGVHMPSWWGRDGGQLMCCLQQRSGVMIEGESIELTIGQSSHMRALIHTLETKGSVVAAQDQLIVPKASHGGCLVSLSQLETRKLRIVTIMEDHVVHLILLV